MHRHFVITHCYHFLAEAIVAFIFLNPFTFDYYHTSHYFGYMIIIFVTAFIFYFIEMSKRPIGYCLVVLPITMYLFYAFEFPIGLVIFFPVLFVWRYVSIRLYKSKQTEHQALTDKVSTNKANLYLHLTIGIAAIAIIYSKEVFVAYYVLLQFFVLMSGYLLSHVIMLNQKERKQVRMNTFSLVPVLMLIGAGLVYLFFDSFRTFMYYIWIGFRTLFVFVIGWGAYLINFLIPKILRSTNDDDNFEGAGGEQGENPFKALLPDGYRPGIDESILTFVVTTIAILIVIYFIFRTMKRKPDDISVREHSATFQALEREEPEKDGFFNRLFKHRRKTPTHPVRHLIYEFEKKAIQNDWGRYPFESLDEWFERLGVDMKIETYQKVRYGDLEVTQNEVDDLRKQLNEIDFEKLKLREELLQ